MKSINRELRAAIVLKFGTQYNFSAALGVPNNMVSLVVCGNKVLNDEQKRHWARVLNVKDIERLFPKG
ncbi:MAG: DUF739 family protein [Proteobacteria bacterium]|nr:DUF739 family protein [Pseudomonadota bacterium]